ncbi:MAG: hypothetical protein ACHQ4H_05715 [Ktedonobacterales bacterium]
MMTEHGEANDDIESETRSQPRDEPAVVEVELDDVLRRHVSRRRRLVRIGASGAAVLLAAVVVLHIIGAPVTPPTTSRPHVPNRVLVALLSNVSFGTVTLNGQRVAGEAPLALALRPGTNTLTFDAAPFAPRACTVSWPVLRVLAGRCVVGNGPLPSADPSVDLAYTLVFDFASADLPPDELASARATVTAAILATRLQTAVPAGHRIATGWVPQTGAVASVATTQPLQATLSFVPARSAACPDGLCPGQDILPAASGARSPAVNAGPVWWVAVPVSYTWTFSVPSGRTVASVTYPSDAPAMVGLVVENGGGWHVWQGDATTQPSMLDAALITTTCDASSVFLVVLPGVPRPAFTSTLAGPRIEGCLLQLYDVNDTMSGALLWRFGVLMAADDQAHAQFPALPLASSGEIRAVVGR